jgi:hypothetical protein
MRWLILGVLAAAACTPKDGPLMMPGQNCLKCHSAGGEEDAPPWAAAGTLYDDPNASEDQGVQGADVELTDANGWTITLHTNQAGNFYTAEKLAFPLKAACVNKDGRRDCMDPPVPYGGCNGCHTQPPQNDAPGRIALPAPGETP